MIILFCLIGVYSLNNNVFEIFILILFGFFGYLLKKMEYSLAPFILAMVLGPMMETSFRQSLTIAQGDLLIFFQTALFRSPDDPGGHHPAGLVGLVGQRKNQRIEGGRLKLTDDKNRQAHYLCGSLREFYGEGHESEYSLAS